MQNNPADRAYNDFLLLVAVPLMMGAVLYFYPYPVSWAWHWITRAEVAFLLHFTDLLPADTVRALAIVRRGLEVNPPGSLGWNVIWKTEVSLSPFNGAMYAVVLFAVGFYVYRFAERHHMRHTTETLIELQTRHWRFSRMWVKHNPLKDKDVTKGPFRIPPSPREFAAQHKLVRKTLGQPAIFDDQAARKVFRERLGPVFVDLDSLTLVPHRWLAAALLLRADGDKAHSDQLLGDISCYYADEFSRSAIQDDVEKILKKYRNHPIVDSLRQKHGYVLSFFCGLQKAAARRCGKITTSMFPWLILEDRELFFTLNNNGRPAYFVEGMAGIVHYLHEEAANMALAKPTDAATAECLRKALVADGVLEPSDTDLEMSVGSLS